MRLPCKDAKTQRNARIDSGLFLCKDKVSCKDAKTQRNARIDSLQVNWSIVERQNLEIRFRNLTLEIRNFLSSFPSSHTSLVPHLSSRYELIN
jgi:hypothetical protein